LTSIQLGNCSPSLDQQAIDISIENLAYRTKLLTFHQRPALIAVPPPRMHPAMVSTSVQAIPVASAQISLSRPGTSNRVKLVPESQDGFIAGKKKGLVTMIERMGIF
jgi:hypothetical protein